MLVDIQKNKMASGVNNLCSMSEYFTGLEGSSKLRYLKKAQICGFDPYFLKPSEFKEDISTLPGIEYPDIVNYLVLQTSWVSKTQMKAYKSLEAYNFFISGWVSGLMTKKAANDRVLVFSRVNHSQRARETPLKAWLLADKSGDVVLAHCNCMAGLGEACSHVGAMLFACEAAVRMQDSVTCTQEANKWLPSHIKNIPYLPVSSVDFTSAKRKYQQTLDIDDHEKENDPSLYFKRKNNVVAPTHEEQFQFFDIISNSCTKSAVLSVVSPYNKRFKPKQINIPPSLTVLYNEKNIELSYLDLLQICKQSPISLTSNECEVIERKTQKQASSRVWFEQRRGRITASKLKAACHTDPHNPSKSLIKEICYPDAHKFSTTATRWGITHECTARRKYEEIMCKSHDCFGIGDSGLNINVKYPHLGASPDGIVTCDCCGKGTCEIKCPYTAKDQTLFTAAAKKGFFLISDGDSLSLDKKHIYYYQVQAQLFICDVEYCDFVVWTQRDIHIERIDPDIAFWEEALSKSTILFNVAILPELVGKWFTRPSIVTNAVEQYESDEEEGPWCYCQEYLEGEELIGCDNDQCKIVWFHMECLKIVIPPEGEWYCPECEKLR